MSWHDYFLDSDLDEALLLAERTDEVVTQWSIALWEAHNGPRLERLEDQGPSDALLLDLFGDLAPNDHIQHAYYWAVILIATTLESFMRGEAERVLRANNHGRDLTDDNLKTIQDVLREGQIPYSHNTLGWQAIDQLLKRRNAIAHQRGMLSQKRLRQLGRNVPPKITLTLDDIRQYADQVRQYCRALEQQVTDILFSNTPEPPDDQLPP